MMQLGISDGFKFGCGFALALASAGFLFIMLAATMFLLATVFNIQLPGWASLGAPPSGVH